ncbi:MAG: dethiobiotin synthase [Bacteroidota bacterium]
MKDSRYVITGIGTDVGKTVVSSILCEVLQFDYWKPLQAGTQPQTDTQLVQSLISESLTCHPEHDILKEPMSPHAAALLEGKDIDLNDIRIPHSDNGMIIEGAGGLMVPINDRETYADLFKKWDIPVIVVSSFYLGSIHHTLSTIVCMQQLGIPLRGIVFNGETNTSSKKVILEMTGVELLAEIPRLDEVHRDSIKDIAKEVAPSLTKKLA